MIIDNKKINIDNEKFNKEININSNPYNYNVIFNKSDLQNTINNEYNLNDILFIDQYIYELVKTFLNIPKNKIFVNNFNENLKSLESVQKLLNFLQLNNFTKGEKLIVVGGGISQDIGSFTSCIYKRGIKWTLIPTTLLSMADSCIGSKSCLNLNDSKNQLGVFYSPMKIIININFLNTLSENDIKSGLGEILRLCSTGGKNYLDLYKEKIQNGIINKLEDIEELIYMALKIKKTVIEIDQYELNIRKALNYGHTLGHAIEKITNYEIPHGIAVAFGMVIINNLFECNTIDELNKLALDLTSNFKLNKYKFDNLENILKRDKKVIKNQLTLVYLKDLGNTKFSKKDINNSLIIRLKEIINKL